MSKKAAIVTLTKSLSQVVGRHRFEKDKPVRVTDPALIEALQADGAFAVKLVDDGAPETKAPTGKVLSAPAPAKGSPVGTAEDKGEEAAEKPAPAKPAKK